MSNRTGTTLIIVAVVALALATLACSAVGNAPVPTQAPTPTNAPPPTQAPVPTQAPAPTRTAAPAKATPTRVSTGKPTISKITFSTDVDKSGDTFTPIHPGTSFADLAEVHAVFDYQGMVDGKDFQRVWTRDGKTALDKTGPWDGGESGRYHLSIYVDTGTLDPGDYRLELYYDGNLFQSGTFTVQDSTSGGPLFKDDFSDPGSGWTVGDSETINTAYKNGKYVITVKTPSYAGWGNPSQTFSGGVMVDVDATMTAGPTDNDFGILCHFQDDYNYYYLGISSDGYAGIMKKSGGGDTQVISGNGKMQKSSAVKTGKGVTNHIQAICDTARLTLVVNGTKAIEVSDDEFADGGVGLRAGAGNAGGVVISFGNLVVNAIK